MVATTPRDAAAGREHCRRRNPGHLGGRRRPAPRRHVFGVSPTRRRDRPHDELRSCGLSLLLDRELARVVRCAHARLCCRGHSARRAPARCRGTAAARRRHLRSRGSSQRPHASGSLASEPAVRAAPARLSPAVFGARAAGADPPPRGVVARSGRVVDLRDRHRADAQPLRELVPERSPGDDRRVAPSPSHHCARCRHRTRARNAGRGSARARDLPAVYRATAAARALLRPDVGHFRACRHLPGGLQAR